MRLGVLDVGSNTVHLLVVDAHRGGHPWPVLSEKSQLRLAELIGPDGALSRQGADLLVAAARQAKALTVREGVEDLIAFATSAVRSATNSADVLHRVRDETGVELQVLPGEDEARLTFLAVRRWFGWSAGRLLVLDIGGGSLELASGIDEEPDVAVSLPLGAGRLTSDFLPGDPPGRRQVEQLRRHARSVVGPAVPRLGSVGPPDRIAATSKTFRSLARIAGAAPSAEGIRAPRTLTRAGLAQVLAKVAPMTAAQRAGLPGVSAGRARQLLAGAVVADAAMHALDLDVLEICPWALREGVILRRLDQLAVAVPSSHLRERAG